jgi:hypothetical protein
MRRKKTGNGSWGRQTIYVLLNFPFFWVIKVGITSRPDLRVDQIDKDNIGIDFLLFKAERYAAWPWEQIHHTLMSPLRWRWWFKGTGKTERFFLPVLIFTLIILLASGVIDLIIFNFQLAVELTAIAALLYGIYYLIA